MKYSHKSKLIAQVVLARCSKKRNLYGITMEKQPDASWLMKYSYSIDEDRARSEGFDKTRINAEVDIDSTFPGCPYCGNTGFVLCGKCGKISCCNQETELYCGWCGTKMTDIKEATQFELSTGED